MCVRRYVHSCNIAILCEDFFSLLVLYVGISCQYCLGECLVQIKTLTLCRRCQIKFLKKFKRSGKWDSEVEIVRKV